MSNNAIRLLAVTCLSSVALIGAANAQTSDEAMRRLEAKIDALAKENASLRSRVNKVEAQPRAAKPKQEQGYVGPIGKPSGDPTPQQVNAARESFAADMPVAVKYAPPPRPACGQFGGWYIGVNGGWASVDSRWVDRDAWVDNFNNDWALGTVSNQHGGGTIGGQIGYNYQTGCTLWGVEVDAGWANVSKTKTYSPVDIPAVGTVLTLSNDLQWFGSLRTRTGVIVDNVLIYATGGLAYAKIKNDWTITDPFNPTESYSAKDSRWGGVLGVGTEWAFAPNWSFRTEFLYYLFKEETTSVFSPAGPGIVSFDHQDSMWVTRAALNYRFDYGKNPVVAKY